MPKIMQKNSNLAYAVRNIEAQQPRREQESHIKQVQKTRARPQRKGIIKTSLCMLYVVALCVSLIYGKVKLTEENAYLQDLKAEYQEVDSESTRLDTELRGMISLKTIEEQARELGLSEERPSQVQYIAVTHDNKAELPEEDDSVWAQITKLYRQIKEYILG